MKTISYEKSLKTNQKVLYINSLFGTVSAHVQKVNVSDRFEGNAFQIEIVSSNKFLTYRIIKDCQALTLWTSLHDKDEIIEMFRRNSFI